MVTPPQEVPGPFEPCRLLQWSHRSGQGPQFTRHFSLRQSRLVIFLKIEGTGTKGPLSPQATWPAKPVDSRGELADDQPQGHSHSCTQSTQLQCGRPRAEKKIQSWTRFAYWCLSCTPLPGCVVSPCLFMERKRGKESLHCTPSLNQEMC